MFYETPLKNAVQKQSPRGVLQKGVLRDSANFIGKHLRQSFFFNKSAGLRPATYLKSDSGTGVFL